MGLFDNLGDLAKKDEEQVEEPIDKEGDVIDPERGGRDAEHPAEETGDQPRRYDGQ